jgi:hypothetical protein
MASSIGPLMAFGAQDTGAVGIIQEHKFTYQLVQVGGDVLAKDAKIRVAVALGHIAQHLVVTAVLLDAVDDVLKHAGLPDAFGHRHRRTARPGRQLGLGEQGITQVFPRSLGEVRQGRRRGKGHERQRPAPLPGIEAFPTSFACRDRFLFGRDMGEVGHVNPVAGRIIDNAARKPADGNQTEHSGAARVVAQGGNQTKPPRFLLELKHRHCVLRAVAGEEPPAGRVERQRVGLRTE